MKNSKKFAMVAATACALALAAERSSAVPSITLFDVASSTSVTVVDGGLGDANAAAGAVTFIGSLGVWTVNVSTGLTKPILGSSTSPSMDLNSIDNSSAAGTLIITFTDTGFNTPAGGSAYATIGGTLGGPAGSSITYKTFQNTNLLTSISANTTPFAGVASAPTTPSANYSLSQQITIVHTGAGNTSFDATLTVPDGGMTAALLGMGLLGVEGLRRKFMA